jgi:hypothetical protein
MGKINWKSQDVLLEEAKQAKKGVLNQQCNTAIIGRFSFTYTDGKTYSASCDAEAQSNFEKVDRAFDKGRMTEYLWTCYDEADNVCRLSFTPDTFEAFYVAHLEHISTTVNRFRDELEPKVDSATSFDELDAIQW